MCSIASGTSGTTSDGGRERAGDVAMDPFQRVAGVEGSFPVSIW